MTINHVLSKNSPRNIGLWMSLWATVALTQASPLFAAAPSDFEWMRPITGNPVAGQLYRVEVPPDMYTVSHPLPRGIRIFDADGHPWPFYLETYTARTVVQRPVTASIINKAWVEANTPYLRMDLALPSSADDSRPRHDRVYIETSGHEFVRRVKVFGAEQDGDWGLIGEGYLIRTTQPQSITERTIIYPEADYPRLQIRVYPNARNAMERFTLQRAEPRKALVEGQSRPTHSISFERLPTPKSEQRENAQVMLLDLGHERHPITSLQLRGDGSDYVRNVVVYVRDDPEANWQQRAAGTVYRIGSRTQDRITVASHGRYVKSEIYHYDDPPIDFTQIEVQAHRDHLIVEAQSGNQPALYYGNHDIAAPRFDLKDRITRNNTAITGSLPVGKATPNTAFRRPGYGAYGPILATVAVAIASITVILVIVRMFQQTAAEQESNSEG